MCTIFLILTISRVWYKLLDIVTDCQARYKSIIMSGEQSYTKDPKYTLHNTDQLYFIIAYFQHGEYFC